jgi:hypothetical protein
LIEGKTLDFTVDLSRGGLENGVAHTASDKEESSTSLSYIISKGTGEISQFEGKAVKKAGGIGHLD